MKQIEKYTEALVEAFEKGFDNYCDETVCHLCDFKKLCSMKKDELMAYLNSEVPENLLTDDEYIILKNLNKQWKWIARDMDLFLCLYTFKPTKKTNSWIEENKAYKSINLFNHLFQFIKWSDDEPYEIEKLLATYEENKHGN